MRHMARLEGQHRKGGNGSPPPVEEDAAADPRTRAGGRSGRWKRATQRTTQRTRGRGREDAAADDAGGEGRSGPADEGGRTQRALEADDAADEGGKTQQRTTTLEEKDAVDPRKRTQRTRGRGHSGRRSGRRSGRWKRATLEEKVAAERRRERGRKRALDEEEGFAGCDAGKGLSGRLSVGGARRRRRGRSQRGGTWWW